MSPGGTIYLLRDGAELAPLDERPYDSEDLLQELLARYPSLLAGEQIDPVAPRRWLLLTRELGVPEEDGGGNRWSLDHLFVDQDAIPTLVEVKRASDTRIRREVVGQMLDYAANATSYVSLDALKVAFEARCRAEGVEPDEAISAVAGDASTFWDRLKTNLRAGRIRLVFVADRIPPSLQRVVEFLNAQMDPAEVLAVEVRQFMGDGLRTLVPRVVGQSAIAEQRKGAGRGAKPRWTEADFLAQLTQAVSPAAAEIARKLLAWAGAKKLRVWWGQRPQGSFTILADRDGEEQFCFALYANGALEIPFQYMASRVPFGPEARRDALRERLNAIPGIRIDRGAIAKRPSFPAGLLEEPSAWAAFVATYEWYLAELIAPKDG
jgi:hypothetical protein